MTPLWIALILIPAGAFMLVYVFRTALPKPPEVDPDDIWDEPSEEDLSDDAEEKEIVDIAESDGRPAPSRPQITMTSRGTPRKSAADSGKGVSRVAKVAADSAGRSGSGSLQKIAATGPVGKAAPTVAANGMPIRAK